MNNKKAIETFSVLKQLEEEKGFPVKFEYAICRILLDIEPIVTNLQKIQNKKIDGQEAYEKEKNDLLIEMSKKDEQGNPLTKQVQNGMQYEIEDMESLNEKFQLLNEKYKTVIEGILKRNNEISNLLEEEVENFTPYLDNSDIPKDDDGNCRLSILQLKYLMPFLNDDINMERV